MTSRRSFLTSSATAAAAAFGASALAQTAQNTKGAEADHSSSNPGQSNTGLVALNPNSNLPPATDHGAVPPIWYSFDLAHRRIQEGGWTHEVTERELPDSKEIAGVNMRLTKGSYRELHWHVADEWAIMLKGNARITVLSPDGSMFIDDVAEGDLWLFPAGYPHSIQGTGDDGCEFLLVFNQGSFSEDSTFLISDWLKHTPPDVLAKNFKLDTDAIEKLPKGDPLYIFPGEAPHQSLAQDRSESASRAPRSKQVFTFRPSQMQPTHQNEHGDVRIVDHNNFAVSTKIAAGIVTLKPGGLRELHWHPSGSEWQFWISGQGRMTVFNAREAARTVDFHANDVGYVPSMAGHYIENTGTTDLVYLEMFATDKYSEVSLNQWLRALPAQVAMAHTNFSAEDLAKIPEKANAIL